MVFASNRGDQSIGVFSPDNEDHIDRIRVGGNPNGLAFDPTSEFLLVANVARRDHPGPVTVSMVDLKSKIMKADIPAPGPTRWAVYDPDTERFFVNVSKPSEIVSFKSKDPDGIAWSYHVPAIGPHGLDLDRRGKRLFCACDQGGLYTLDLTSG